MTTQQRLTRRQRLRRLFLMPTGRRRKSRSLTLPYILPHSIFGGGLTLIEAFHNLPETEHSDVTDIDDRIAGVLVGHAVGDALGVPYEFKPPLPDDYAPEMIGGGLGPFEPGEYSDDTQMAVCIAHAMRDTLGADLNLRDTLDVVAKNFTRWYASGPADIGMQTSTILGQVATLNDPTSHDMHAMSHHYAMKNEHSAGNGSLMRTAPVALAYLDNTEGMDGAAAAVSALTHTDPDCFDACVLWTNGIRTAILDGTFDGVREGIALLPYSRRALWTGRLNQAEAYPPRHFAHNGWVVEALQAAWSAITRTPVPEDDPSRHFTLALEAAVRCGNDTDTVAAIAGGLLGARWGRSAIPEEWQHDVHGWPGLDADDLADLALHIVANARGDDASDDANGGDDTDDPTPSTTLVTRVIESVTAPVSGSAGGVALAPPVAVAPVKVIPKARAATSNGDTIKIVVHNVTTLDTPSLRPTDYPTMPILTPDEFLMTKGWDSLFKTATEDVSDTLSFTLKQSGAVVRVSDSTIEIPKVSAEPVQVPHLCKHCHELQSGESLGGRMWRCDGCKMVAAY